MNLRFSANTWTTLAGGIDSTQTWLFVTAGNLFPNLNTTGGYFYLDLVDDAGYYETPTSFFVHGGKVQLAPVLLLPAVTAGCVLVLP